MRIAFLGTGLMGLPMATNLAKARYSLCAWNRTPAKAAPVLAFGASVARTPTQCVKGADVTIAVLENGPVVEKVVFDSGLAKHLKAGSLFIDMSSIPPITARRHSESLSSAGIKYLDAPVSGGPYGAADASLAIMVGGAPDDFIAAKPVLSKLGNPVYVGPVGSGLLTKLGSQIIVASAIAAISEALLLVQAGGADPNELRAALSGGLSDSKVLQIHGQRMLERNFTPGGHVRTHRKDLDAAIAEARQRGLNLPLTAHLLHKFEDACKHKLGDYDHSALILELEALNPRYSLDRGTDQIAFDSV